MSKNTEIKQLVKRVKSVKKRTSVKTRVSQLIEYIDKHGGLKDSKLFKYAKESFEDSMSNEDSAVWKHYVKLLLMLVEEHCVTLMTDSEKLFFKTACKKCATPLVEINGTNITVCPECVDKNALIVNVSTCNQNPIANVLMDK